MSMVTTPLGLTRAVMLMVMPVLSELTVLLNTLLPLDCTPPTTACEVSTGTSVPTFMVAGMLSVAMMLGEEMMRACPLVSCAWRTPRISLLAPTSVPNDRPKPPLLMATFSARPNPVPLAPFARDKP
jgi:hypothetical protein